ncbi:MAG: F0F1 ATP synthase subunit epsilon [Pseudomonadota bacterium]
MAATFKFELVSPERVVLLIDADEVILPGSEGQMGVLAGHAPVVSTLNPGVITVVIGNNRRRVYVNGGFAEVRPDQVTVLAEQAQDVDQMSASAIAAELERARQALTEASGDEAVRIANEAVTVLSGLKPER